MKADEAELVDKALAAAKRLAEQLSSDATELTGADEPALAELAAGAARASRRVSEQLQSISREETA